MRVFHHEHAKRRSLLKLPKYTDALRSQAKIPPAPVAEPLVQARSAEDTAIATAQTGVPTTALDEKALKTALLELSPAEKLRIAGDRIRLAKSNVQSTSKGTAVKQTASAQATCANCGPRTPSMTATCGGARRAR